MSKLNRPGKNVTTVRGVAAKHNLTVGVSANGNVQFNKEPMQMLYELTVSTLFGRGTFYKSTDKVVAELKQNLKKVVAMDQLDFVANLAVHARSEMNIRTIPIVLVVEFAKELREQNKQFAHMRSLVASVIQRADQINDMYAYALEVFGDKGKVPMAIKRGVGDAFNKFGEYNFAKYNRDGAVKFRDVLRIVHPAAKSVDQGAIFDKIMKETLEAPYTWEVELSRNGQLPEVERKSKAQLWTELYTSGKMGYMAQLRNLRNLTESGANATVIADVAKYISDPVAVSKSKQLPFDFVEAYRAIGGNGKLATAVSKAIDESCGNLPQIGEKVWIIIDFSGSMGTDQCLPITNATLMAAALLKAHDGAVNVGVTLFGSSAMTLNGVDTNKSVLDLQKHLLSFRRGGISGSTNFNAALQEKGKLGFEPDTIIVLTDGEVNHFPYSNVSNIAAKSVVKLVINLEAATTTPFISQNGWYTLAGWSTAMFQFIPAIRDKQTVVDTLSGSFNQ